MLDAMLMVMMHAMACKEEQLLQWLTLTTVLAQQLEEEDDSEDDDGEDNERIVRSLPRPRESAWISFCMNASDSSFLQATSLTRSSFSHLCTHFSRFYEVDAPAYSHQRESTRQHHHEALGLLLCFYVGSMTQTDLCRLSGLEPSALSTALETAEAALEKALKQCAAARISWPSLPLQKRLARLMQASEPLLYFTYGAVTHKTYKVEAPSPSDLREDWPRVRSVSSMLCVGSDGCIFSARCNAPSSSAVEMTRWRLRDSVADASMCADPRYNLVASAAYPGCERRVLTPLKKQAIDRMSPSTQLVALAMHRAVLSALRTANRRVDSIKTTYGRLAMPLPCNPRRRAQRLTNAYRLHNYRIRTALTASTTPTNEHARDD